MNIEAIIWDVGGVLVRTEDWAPREKLADRLGLTGKELNDLVFGTPENAPAQLGKISHEEHWDNIRQSLQMSVDEVKQVEKEFFTGDILDGQLIEFIRSLKPNYRTAILSNALSSLRHTLSNEWNIADAFDVIIVSAEEGLMKPAVAIYELTLERLGINPQQAVFIDDFAHNIVAANELGIHTIQFESTDQTITDLQAILVLDTQK